MSTQLDQIVDSVRGYAGVLRKRPIRAVHEILSPTLQYGEPLPNYGDDAAVIPRNGEFLLLAADGMMTALLINEPYAAGKAAVMVTVNDIYSMGGRPLGMVNVLASGIRQQRADIVEGIAKGCRKLKVPMLGGHLHPDAAAEHPALSVAILGYARKLLRSHLAQSGDDLILAVDLKGRAGCRSVVSWDANSGKSSEELLYRLEALPLIAENDLALACKDISNAGILGTVAIMLENSGQGAVIDLEAIPRPESLALSDWLRSFQSFGFTLAVKPSNSRAMLDLFSERAITAQVIGRVCSDRVVRVAQGGVTRTLFDFQKEEITGISCR